MRPISNSNPKRKLLASLVSILFFATALTAAPAIAAVCDPHAKELDGAKTLTGSGKFNEAQIVVDRILARDPTDFRANYQKGVIIVNQADAADRVKFSKVSPFPTGISLLVKTAGRLTEQDQHCAKKKNFYTILNTIGAEYLNRGNFSDAQKYLMLAYEKKDMLDSDTTVKLLDNLGLVYLLQNRFDLSTRYYQEAKSAGSTIADNQIRTASQLSSVIKPITLPSRNLAVMRRVIIK